MRAPFVAFVLLVGASASVHADSGTTPALRGGASTDAPPPAATDGEQQQRVLLSVSAGSALALTALAVGGVTLATEESNAGRKVGALTMVSGLALSPIVSHAIAGEWGRAAWFGAVPVAAAVGATILIESAPTLLGHGTLGQRRALTLCYAVDLLGAAVGLFDSMNAGERARARTLALGPWLERGSLGVAVGGLL